MFAYDRNWPQAKLMMHQVLFFIMAPERSAVLLTLSNLPKFLDQTGRTRRHRKVFRAWPPLCSPFLLHIPVVNFSVRQVHGFLEEHSRPFSLPNLELVKKVHSFHLVLFFNGII